ncbi:MAG: DUF4293 domain-containing protein [Cyclobacteriaceae bacterium]|nr:DUF4293 domain-containing protein [Cyclobacteriaceae bacterium]
MWQRFQTVLLALVALCMVVGIFLPIWQGVEESGATVKLFALHLSRTDNGVSSPNYFPYAATGILMIAAATLAIFEIRRYENRVLQIKIGMLNTLILTAAIATAYFFVNEQISHFEGSSQQVGLTVYIIFGGVFCNWLSIRLIRRDEKLVRDSDRIR